MAASIGFVCRASIRARVLRRCWRSEKTATGDFRRTKKIKRRERRYRGDTLILETEIETETGAVRLIDFMPPRGNNPDIVRIVEGVSGRCRCGWN